MTPEGRQIEPRDSSWWSLMVRNARAFLVVYRENVRLRGELEAVRLAQAAPVANAQHASGSVATDAPAGEAGRAAKPTEPNLLLEHFRKCNYTFAANTPFHAIKPIASQ